MVQAIKLRRQIGEILLERGWLTTGQLETALARQKSEGHRQLLGELLVEMGFVAEEQVVEALAEGYGVPFARISPRLADPKAIELLPREFLEKHTVLPLFKVRNQITVAMAEVANVFLVEEIERMTECQVQVVAAAGKDLRATLTTHMPSANVFVIDEIIEDVNLSELSVIEEAPEDIGNLEEVAGQSPVVKLVNYLLFTAVKEGASDIHIEPDDNALRVRYRVDGRLYEKLRPPAKMHAAVVSRIKIMSRMDISERRLPQDGGMHVLMQGRPVDLRISTMPGKHGEKVVIRVIDNRSVLVSLDKIGFSYEMLKLFRKEIARPHGLVLVTGPTGSGKSTTLYAVLNELSGDDVNVCTVEDPIEFNLPWINQFQVNEKIGFTFAGSLRALLRQDPDAIMVGEIRDQETARIATQASLTGHMVLSTLHTNDAPGAITRLFNVGVEPYLVAASLTAVVAQRLVRKICTNCKEVYEPPINIRRAIEKIAGEFDVLYQGAGCKKCRNTGFSGRMGIFELLVPSDEMRDAIASGAGLSALRELSKKSGLLTLRDDGLLKVKAGITTPEEIFTATAG
ncbi:MAG: ATPase, T2SS/T4P/T4SS family [Phycisphaerae bacterium]|nr:ATPase, T2SS/T4P/T4SS family [Phycisphaerae bacterium]